MIQVIISEALLTHSCLITLQVVLRELESDLLPGQLLVDRREGVGLVFNVGLLSFVKMNLKHEID